MFRKTQVCLLLVCLITLFACAPASEQQPLPTLAVLPSLTPSAETVIHNETIPTTEVAAAQPSKTAIPVQPTAVPTGIPAAPLPIPTDAPVQSPLPTSMPIAQPPPAQPVQNQLVIRFAPGTSLSEQQQYLKTIGGTIESQIVMGQETSVVVQVPAGVTLDSLPASPAVAASEPDYFVSAQVVSQPNDPYFDQQYALPMMNVPQAWPSLPAAPEAVAVAVIDSGVCANHPDLQGRILPGWDWVENDGTPQDTFGHGCAVAGIIAANADNGVGIAGIAPNAMIMPLRVLDERGLGTYSNVAAALVWAADNGAQIINLSLGGANSSATLESAVQYAIGKGVMVIAAAGNTGGDTLLYPAAYPDVIAVGSVDASGARSSFSSTNAAIDLWAPGVDIHSTSLNGGYAASSGTSFAAPQAAGVAALEMALGETLTVDGGILSLQANWQLTTVTPSISDETPTPASVEFTATPPQDWMIYTNDEQGYSVTIPSSWHVLENALPGRYQAYGQTRISSIPLTEDPLVYDGTTVEEGAVWLYITLTSIQRPVAQSLEEYVREFIVTPYTGVSNVRRYFGDIEALQLSNDFSSVYVVAHKSNVYSIVFSSSPDSVAESLLHRIISSLRFSGIQPTNEDPFKNSIPWTQNTGSTGEISAASLPTLLMPWDRNSRYTLTSGPHHRSDTNYSQCVPYPSSDETGLDFGLPNGTEVLAAAGGNIIVAVYDPTVQNMVRIDHGGGWTTDYWHLTRILLSSGQVQQGRVIATSGSGHLHLELRFNGTHFGAGWHGRFIDSYQVFSVLDAANTSNGLNYQGSLIRGNPVLSATYPHSCISTSRNAVRYNGSVQTLVAGEGGLISSTNIRTTEPIQSVPLPPANTNIITNGDFSSGMTGWQTWGSIVGAQVSNGVFQFYRSTGSSDWAVVYQSPNYRADTNMPFEITLQLGNSSAVNKVMGVALRDTSTWTGSLETDCAVPANSPLKTYILRGKSPAAWSKIQLEIGSRSADGQPYHLIDNVVVQYRPDLNITGGFTCAAAINAPSGLTATPVSKSQINLSWNDNSGDETEFRIERSTDNTNWTQIGTVGANVKTYASTGLDCGTRYYYRVRAYSSATNSLPDISNVVSAVTTCPIPGTPVLAAPASGAQTNDTTPDLTWSAAADAVKYRVQIATACTFAADTIVQDAPNITATSYTATTLAERANYCWHVQGINRSDQSGAWSAYRTFTIDLTPPAAPVLKTPADNTQLTTPRPAFAWNASATAASYRLQVSPAADFSRAVTDVPNLTTLTYTAAASLPQGVYYWRVQARDAAGNNSAFSTPRSLKISILRAPVDNAASTSQRPAFAWYAFAGAVGYQLQVDDNADFGSPFISEPLPASRLTYTPTTAMPYNLYYWRVNVNLGSGFEPSDSIWRIIISPTLPPAPALLTPAANGLMNDSTPDLTWSAVSAPGSPFTYHLQVDNDSLFRSPECEITVAGTAYTCGPLVDGRYYWRVQALNYLSAPGNWSALRYFTVDTIAPAAPVLKTPANGGIVTAARPAFTWNAAATAARYHIQIALDESFGAVVQENDNVATTTFTATAALPQGGYWWRVRAKDAAGNWGSFSTPFSFDFNIQRGPVNNAMSTSQRPTFSWYAYAGTLGYQLQVDDDSDFSSPLTDQPLSAATVSYLTPTAMPFGIYYWRVNVNTGSGFIASPFYRTLTITPAAPAAPVLSMPATNSLLGTSSPVLAWNDVTGLGSPFIFRIQIDDDLYFRSPAQDEIVTETQYMAAPLADGRYYWRVQAINNLNVPGKWSGYWLLTVDTTPPPVPLLKTPANGALISTNLPTLVWNASATSVSYEVVFNQGSTATSVVYTGSAQTWTPSTPLLQKMYSWAVRSKDAVGNWSAYSDAWNFTVVSAANAMSYRWRFTTHTPTLRWTPISWASVYQIQVDNVSTFTSPEYQAADLVSNSATTTALPPGVFYWRVRAKNGATGTWGDWSATESFFIEPS